MAQKHTLIIGGGVIGAATAYYLTEQSGFDAPNHKITVIEAVDVAHAASGKAGGLLSVNMALHTPETEELATLSWKLHADLAEKHQGVSRWEYRRLDMISLTAHAAKSSTPFELPSDLETGWLNANQITSCRIDGKKETSGQVTGFKFTSALLDLAKERGVEVILGSVVGATYASNGSTISSVQYVPKGQTGEKNLAVTEVVLAAGPWSGRVFEKIKPAAATYEMPIFGTRSHSILINTAKPIPPIAVFTSYKMQPSEKTEADKTSHKADGYHLEFYPRPQHLYVCGPVDRSVLPDVHAVQVDSPFCDRMYAMASQVSHALADGTLHAKQSCYMPMVQLSENSSSNDVQSAPPLVGRLPQIDNAVAATGHSCWGMMLAPATGFIVAELLTTGSINSLPGKLAGLDPRRIIDGSKSTMGRTKKWNINPSV